jgi:hypothetical protein
MARSTPTAATSGDSPVSARPGWPLKYARRAQALLVLIGWLLGVVSVLGWAMLSGGWYEYFVPESEAQVQQMVNQQGWELVSDAGAPYLRRPRVRFPGSRGSVPAGAPVRPTVPVVAPRPTVTVESQPAQTPVALSGSAALQQTEPFLLAEGSYRVEWSASASPERNCFFRARLYMVGQEGVVIDIVNRAIPNGQTAQGATFVHDVGAGQYYLDLTPLVGEPCRWRLSMAPR